MKVWMRLDVDAQTRYIIAKYYKKQGLARATRLQVQRFAKAALRSAVREQAEKLAGRARATAQRLAVESGEATGDAPREYLTEPPEKQRSLAW